MGKKGGKKVDGMEREGGRKVKRKVDGKGREDSG